MNAASYGRNSKPPSGWRPAFAGQEPPGSYSVQLEKAAKWAGAAGDEVTVQEHDVASGGNANRPGWGRIMAAVRGGSVRRVYATKLDRVARNLRHFLVIAEDFEARGAELVFVDQPAASVRKADPAGKAMRNMLATFAEFELDLIRERTGAVMTVGEDGRTYGPRSAKPAGRPKAFGDGHKLRKRGSATVHDKARCPACRGENGGSLATVSEPLANVGVAEPVGFATPGQADSAGVVAGVQQADSAAPAGNLVVAKGPEGA